MKSNAIAMVARSRVATNSNPYQGLKQDWIAVECLDLWVLQLIQIPIRD